MLTDSGVDEAWTTGVQLAEAVLELLRSKQPFTRENLERTYVARRRESALDKESKVAAKARVGFRRGFVRGVIGTALTGLTRGRLNAPGGRKAKAREAQEPGRVLQGHASPLARSNASRPRRAQRSDRCRTCYMDRAGWPSIPFDGELLVSHQDALLLGGKVQAPPGYADHVVFLAPAECEACETKPCVDICSGQALTLGGESGVPALRPREVHTLRRLPVELSSAT